MAAAAAQYDEKERETIKASLKSWWSNFTKTGKGASKERKAPPRVFGEPLRKSLKYASVAISMSDEEGNQYVWGYVPVVVAKVGLFLKENATEVEGVFRIAGSQKRMRELQEVFDTPPKYGKQLEWERYSVHDAASVLRRYLNQMPEPIVPLQLYNEFRNVMQKQQIDVDAAIRTYRLLIQAMPPANRYLLLYVLDLLAVFARKSDTNLMPASNLAVIFQPGIFSHPSHLQDATEHKTAVEVLEFLIDHQDHFVLGISPPPPTNVGPSELTNVSLPAVEAAPDVADLSESDEELGELVVHQGGGANLARRSTAGAHKKGESSSSGARGLFRSRSSKRSKEQPTFTGDAGAQASERFASPTFESERTATAAGGDIREIGLREQAPAEPQTVLAKVRRSKTLPSGRRAKNNKGDATQGEATEGSNRSVSAGKALEAPSMAKSASAAPATINTEQLTPQVDSAVSPAAAEGVASAEREAEDPGAEHSTAGAEVAPASAADVGAETAHAPFVRPDLPTPPSSKVLESGGPVSLTAEQDAVIGKDS